MGEKHSFQQKGDSAPVEDTGKSKAVAVRSTKFKRPQTLAGETVKLRSSLGNLYVTVNYEEEAGERSIREVFIHLGKGGTQVNALVEALGRIISVALQYNTPLHAIIEQLQWIKTGEGVRQDDGQVVFSVPDAVAYALECVAKKDRRKDKSSAAIYDLCPQCGGALIKVGSCLSCTNCSYSTCY